MKNVYLFQPQYAVDLRKETNYWLPYSAGCIWSYAEQYDFVKENFQLADLFFSRLDPQKVIEKLDNPVVCGFSCYLWNEKYCLAVAELIKKKWPECYIIFGGPQPTTATLDHWFVDSVILGEGEEHFVSVLRSIHEGRDPEELFLKNRLNTLEIPSPYLNGTFDKIIADNPDVLWAVTMETNRGCPYACTFCNWGSVTYSKVKKFDLERVRAEMKWASNNPVVYMFIADANFGIFKERDVEIARMIRDVSIHGQLEAVNLTYAKNSTEIIFEIGKIIGNLSKGVTVSVQSMNQPTLEAIKRNNLDANDVRYYMSLSEQNSVPTYTEVIIGLPEETLESWKQGFDQILEMGQHNAIDVWPCQVLENSELASPESRNKYGIKTVVAHEYTPFYNKNDYMDISETVEIVNATNTMSTDELVEAYMYGWMIVQFHILGYTQLYAKYARHILGIPYRKFYDIMFEKIQREPFFGPMFDHIKQNIRQYLTTGKFADKTMSGHTLSGTSAKNIYTHKSQAFDLGLSCLCQFTDTVEPIGQLQKNFIYSRDIKLPALVELPWNIHTWEQEPTKYVISTKLAIDEKFNFFTTRRNGLLKNIFTKIS